MTGDKEALKETLLDTGVRNIGGKGAKLPRSEDLSPTELPLVPAQIC